jgi:DNA-binding LacI/PurR family transcriptional regulator
VRQIVDSSVELIATALEESEEEHVPQARLFPAKLVERGTLRPPQKD